jgi:hypothetical protein
VKLNNDDDCFAHVSLCVSVRKEKSILWLPWDFIHCGIVFGTSISSLSHTHTHIFFCVYGNNKNINKSKVKMIFLNQIHMARKNCNRMKAREREKESGSFTSSCFMCVC